MKSKLFSFAVFCLALFLIGSVNEILRTWPVVVYETLPATEILPGHGEEEHTEPSNRTEKMKIIIQGPNKTYILEKKKKDPQAVFLSEQTPPPFDPDFKNPCWWIGQNNDSLACLPYFYLAGFPKSGTTDLFSRLRDHPFVQPGLAKEPHYLTRGFFDYGRPCNNGEQFFKYAKTSCDIFGYADRFFKGASRMIKSLESDHVGYSVFADPRTATQTFKYPKITVDGSASTAWDNRNGFHIIRDIHVTEPVSKSNASVLDWIVRINPDVRFVVILREPISRAYSDYNYFHSRTSPEQFDQEVDQWLKRYDNCIRSGSSLATCLNVKEGKTRIHIGAYHVHIEQLLIRLSPERIHVIRSEDYKQNMKRTLMGVYRFLGLPQLKEKRMDEVVNSNQKNVNKRNVEPMLPSTRQKLKKFYEPFNKNLAKLLHNDAFLWRDVYSKDLT